MAARLKVWQFRLRTVMLGITVVGFISAGVHYAIPHPEPRYVEVTGILTLDGAPVTSGTVELFYENGEISSGVSNEVGQFRLTSGKQSGALLGKARVAIHKTKRVRVGTLPLPRKCGNSDPNEYITIDDLPPKYKNCLCSNLCWEIKRDTDFISLNLQNEK